MRGIRTLLFVLLILSLGAAGASPAAAAPVRDHQITPEDYFTLATVTGCAVSPSGGQVAYTEMRWDRDENKRNTDLWVVDAKGREVTRLTFDPAGDGSPQWSPDGRWVYFTSGMKRDDGDKPPYNGKKQVWRVSPTGGEIFAVTRLAEGIDSYQLSRDGRTLYYTIETEQVDDDDWKSLRKEFKKLDYGNGVESFGELWKLDLETWRAEQILADQRYIVDFSVAPDGSRAALITRPDQHLITNEGWSRVDILNLETGKLTTLPDQGWRDEAPSPYGWLLGLTWSGDSSTLAFRVDFDGYPGEVFFARFEDSGLAGIRKMVRPDEVTVTGAMKWMPGTHTFCFLAEDHARERVYAVTDAGRERAGASKVLTPGDVTVGAFSFSRDGRTLCVLTSGLDHPPDLFLVDNPGPKARLDRLTEVNPQVDTWKMPQIRIVKWTSTDGTPVEGILELPPDYDGGEPLPLVVEIHGGPTASTLYRFRYWIYGRTIFAARGWALLSPNYRGSTGYGDKFLTDLIGNKNNLDVEDILSGVDALIDRGIADPERMAVMGWSNGGFLTNAIITRDNRFKAASSGAGVFDTAMQWSIEDTPGHVINFSGGLPWEQPEKMLETSPLYDVDKVKTPTIIHVGERDPRVPQEHSRGLYRALKHYVKVPTELIIYPGEGHGLTKYTHRQAKLAWDLKWFDHYVLDEDETPDEPEIPGS